MRKARPRALVKGLVLSPDHEKIFTLHRYFVWANRQRDYFFEGVTEPPKKMAETQRWVKVQFVNVCYWIGSLYVVVEGWQQLKLSDKDVDTLLTSPHVYYLRRFRNGVFHFQKSYFDQRFLALFEQSDGMVWVTDLHKAFSRFFLGWFRKRGIRVAIGKEVDRETAVYVSVPRLLHR